MAGRQTAADSRFMIIICVAPGCVYCPWNAGLRHTAESCQRIVDPIESDPIMDLILIDRSGRSVRLISLRAITLRNHAPTVPMMLESSPPPLHALDCARWRRYYLGPSSMVLNGIGRPAAAPSAPWRRTCGLVVHRQHAQHHRGEPKPGRRRSSPRRRQRHQHPLTVIARRRSQSARGDGGHQNCGS